MIEEASKAISKDVEKSGIGWKISNHRNEPNKQALRAPLGSRKAEVKAEVVKEEVKAEEASDDDMSPPRGAPAVSRAQASSPPRSAARKDGDSDISPRAADNAMIRMVTYHPLVLLQHRALVMILMLICLLLGVHLLSADPRLHLRPGLLYARTAIVISHPHAADNAMIQMLTYHPLVLLHRKAAAMIQMLTCLLPVVLQRKAAAMIQMLTYHLLVVLQHRAAAMIQMLTYHLLVVLQH